MADTTAPAVISERVSTLPEAVRRRGVDEAQWATLCNSLYPGARPESVLLVIDYCRSRRLDPLKKPCHIVPMEVHDARTNTKQWRDVVLPGIYEHRTTATRTGEYLGYSSPNFGPEIDYRGVKCFEWCDLSVFRWHVKTDQKIAFPVRIYFREVVTLNREGKPNARWTRAPIQMLLKCAEAAALRAAFPDELGGEHTAEELDGARLDLDTTAIDVKPLPPKPEHFDTWVEGLASVAEQGTVALREVWKKDNAAAYRDYLIAADPARWTEIKTRAEAADTRDREAKAAAINADSDTRKGEANS